MAEKPKIAFILSLVAAVLVVINGLILAVNPSLVEEVLSGLPEVLTSLSFSGIGSIVIGILMLICSVVLYSTNKSRITVGSILVVIFSIVSIFAGGGFFIGAILGIVGGILGLIRKPSEKAAPPPPSS